MLWLEQEGFLRYESTLRQEAIDQACLTMKGLAFASTICRDPKLIEISTSIEPLNTSFSTRQNIVALKHILVNGTSTQLALAMQSLLELYSDY